MNFVSLIISQGFESCCIETCSKKNICFPYSIFAGYIIWKAYGHIEIVFSIIDPKGFTSKDINNVYKTKNKFLEGFYIKFVRLLKKFNFDKTKLLKFIYFQKFTNNQKLYGVPLYIFRGIIDNLNIMTYNELDLLITKIKNLENL